MAVNQQRCLSPEKTALLLCLLSFTNPLICQLSTFEKLQCQIPSPTLVYLEGVHSLWASWLFLTTWSNKGIAIFCLLHNS